MGRKYARVGKAGPLSEPKRRIEADVILSASTTRLLLGAGLRPAHLGAWMAWQALGRSTAELVRVAGQSDNHLRELVNEVRAKLAELNPELCATCHAQPARYCVYCLAKARKRAADEPG